MTFAVEYEKTNSLHRIVTWVLVLSPILQTYGWGKYDFAFILTSLVGILVVIYRKYHFNCLPQYLSLYLAYWLLIHAISASSLQGSISLGVLKVLLVFGTFFSVVPLSLLVRYYKIVANICIAFFAVQLFIKYLFDINVLGVFSFLPVALDADTSDYFADRASSERLSSFFSEPAIFAQYLVPYLCLILFDKTFSSRKRIYLILILVGVFLLLQSGNALVGLTISIAMFFLFRMKGGIKKKIQTALLGGVLLIVGIFFFQTEMGEKLLSRKEQVSINSVDNLGYSTSGFERIFRGYYIYAGYSGICKIIGNDNPQYKKEAALGSELGFLFSEDRQDYLYCNTFQIVLLNTGLIGMLIMFFVFRGIWKTTNQCGKDLLLSFFALSLLSSSYFSELMCLYMLIPTLMGRIQSHYE